MKNFVLLFHQMKQTTIHIKNKRASYEYELLQKYIAGIQLTGTEIKAIRAGLANISDAFCQFRKKELFVVNMHISEYTYGTHFNHIPNQPRKLLLKKGELKQIHKKITEKGLTIVPLSLFLSERGFAKLEIAIAKGKKSFDKRQSIKAKDVKREMDRMRQR